MIRAITLLLAFTVGAAPLAAQAGMPQLELRVLSGTGGSRASGVGVVASGLLLDSKTRELLRHGFPAELRYRVELWREARWADDLEGATEWVVLVSYDPVNQVYNAVRRHGNQLEDFGSFGSVEGVDAMLSRSYRLGLAPRVSGRQYYYTISVDVQTLSVSDLDELQRWLRGEFQPAVSGRSSVGGAMRRGFGTLLSRVLGGDSRHYERRSERFSS